MKKVIVLIVTLLCLTSCTYSILSKTVRCKGSVEERALVEGSFSSLEVNGAFDIDFVQGDPAPVIVKTNSDAFEYLNVHIKDNGTLVIETKNKIAITTEICHVSLSSQLLKKVEINGAANFKVEGGYKSNEDFSFEVNGAGKTDMSGIEVPTLRIDINGAAGITAKDLAVEKLAVEINGTASMTASGTAGKASLTVNGMGKINASDLSCSDINVEKNGLALITLPKSE